MQIVALANWLVGGVLRTTRLLATPKKARYPHGPPSLLHIALRETGQRWRLKTNASVVQ